MSNTARVLALLVSAAMFVFSSWVYINTGDWVAAFFALASVAYAFFFFSFGGGFRGS
ncbi:hypothetical protein [Parahalioglobus pacificus]|uniref:Uncharacterized protein n=1 Tax=Parahalioglobus pacificus TaxID=930806 RepID=A0A919CJ89_9GAMM|nr:hypothetical protein [Halioglobus pacificus]NQY03561.1 hypothetical protein [Halieaceae bacterium]GHD29925.1 hypothetical protein GCM10007053_11160 [Halioglobus pacificus]